MSGFNYAGPGLTVTRFLNSLSERQLRRCLDPGVLAVLDAIFGGKITGDDLQRVALTLVDLDVLIGEAKGRKLVLGLVPQEKKAELEERVERSISPANADDWADAEVRSMRDFFGLVEERIIAPDVPPTDSITPEYDLFDHQRNAVRKLTPLLCEGERRVVLHLPTGVGKTRTAMHVIADSLRRYEPSVVVWLASGKELLEQAVVAFREAWKHLGNRPLEIGPCGATERQIFTASWTDFSPSGLAKGWAVISRTTGVGKTRTAMHVIADSLRRYEPSVVVWLASGKELLEQAVVAFREAWKHLGNRPLEIGTMWGDRTPDLHSFLDGFLAVGLAKGWAVISRTDPEWAARLSSRVRLVVFDEAHQSVARTYRRITDDLTLDYRCALLGLTATPGRTWADIDKDGPSPLPSTQLADYFSGNKVTLDVPGTDDLTLDYRCALLGLNPIEYLIDNGFLARPTFRTLFAEPGLSIDDFELDRIAEALDIPEFVLSAMSMSEQYVTAILAAIEGLIGDGHQRVLVFAATVAQAQLLSAILVARDVRSEVVTGTTSARVRDRAIRTFKSDNEVPMVLVNFGVLTTGFDAPEASAAVIARPTKSLVLYSQMVGRAIRGPKAGGTEACEIVTVVDPSLPGFGDVAMAFLNWEDVWL